MDPCRPCGGQARSVAGGELAPTGDADGSRRDRAGPLHRPGEFGAARTDQAGQPDDLARPHLQRDVVHPGRGQAGDGEHHRRLAPGRPLGRERGAQRPAEHRAQQGLLGLVGRVRRADDAAVAEDGHLLREVEYLPQEMRDQDDRRARPGEPADDLVQPDRVRAGQGGRGLVHDDQPGVARQRPQDLDLLLVGGPQAAGGSVTVELEAHRAGEFGVTAPQRGPAQEAGPARLGAEEDVLRDRQRGHERQFLGDEHDPARDRLPGRVEAHRLAAEQHLPAIGRDDPGNDLPQGGLARAVLTDEGVDRPPGDLEADRLQGARRAEGLADVPQLDVRTLEAWMVRHLSRATRR